MRRLPLTTPIRFSQDNPKLKGSKSRERYERYKSATSIKDFLPPAGVGTYSDLSNDFLRRYVEIPTVAAVNLLHPVLAVAAFSGGGVYAPVPYEADLPVSEMAPLLPMPAISRKPFRVRSRELFLADHSCRLPPG